MTARVTVPLNNGLVRLETCSRLAYLAPCTRCPLTLDGITALIRLNTQLKRDILQPQPVNESNPTTAPTVLPEPLTEFLGKALGIPAEIMDNCWSILRNSV